MLSQISCVIRGQCVLLRYGTQQPLYHHHFGKLTTVIYFTFLVLFCQCRCVCSNAACTEKRNTTLAIIVQSVNRYVDLFSKKTKKETCYNSEHVSLYWLECDNCTTFFFFLAPLLASVTSMQPFSILHSRSVHNCKLCPSEFLYCFKALQSCRNYCHLCKHVLS